MITTKRKMILVRNGLKVNLKRILKELKTLEKEPTGNDPLTAAKRLQEISYLKGQFEMAKSTYLRLKAPLKMMTAFLDLPSNEASQ